MNMNICRCRAHDDARSVFKIARLYTTQNQNLVKTVGVVHDEKLIYV